MQTLMTNEEPRPKADILQLLGSGLLMVAWLLKMLSPAVAHIPWVRWPLELS